MDYNVANSAHILQAHKETAAQTVSTVPVVPSYNQALNTALGQTASLSGQNTGILNSTPMPESGANLNTYLMVQQQQHQQQQPAQQTHQQTHQQTYQTHQQSPQESHQQQQQQQQQQAQAQVQQAAPLYSLRPDTNAYYFASPAGPHPSQTLMPGISHQPQLSAPHQYAGIPSLASPGMVLTGGLTAAAQPHSLPSLGPVPGGGGFSSYSQYGDQPEMLPTPVQLHPRISPHMGSSMIMPHIGAQRALSDSPQGKKVPVYRRRAMTRAEEEFLERYGNLNDNDNEDSAALLRSDYLNGGSADFEGIDQRMSRLANHLLQQPLADIVSRIREDEHGPLAEKSRQIFAMTWLLRACHVDSSATTPRNRVFARYITACTKYGLRPLNQAALGKLVRTTFPNTKVRRLGVRGQSRYRYCGIAMVDEIDGATEASESSDKQNDGSPIREGFREDGSPTSRSGHDSDQTAGITAKIAEEAKNRMEAAMAKDFLSVNKCFASLPVPNIDSVQPENIYEAAQRRLKIPDIAEYAQDFDQDLRETLLGLVHAQCRQALDALRVSDANQFLSALSAVYGKLTTPLQKAAATPPLLHWFRRCDSALFAAILNALYPALFLLPPERFVTFLHAVAAHMTRQCQERQKAKELEMLKPDVGLENRPSMEILHDSRADTAVAFVTRLNRLLRVSHASKPAAEALARAEQMATEWEEHVSDTAASEALYNNVHASQAVTTVPRILHSIGEVFAQKANDNVASSDRRSVISDQDQINILEPWVGLILRAIVPVFLFPARAAVASYSIVFSAALRDIARAKGKTLSSWWVFRCWADDGLSSKVDMGEADMESESGVLLYQDGNVQDGLKVNYPSAPDTGEEIAVPP